MRLDVSRVGPNEKLEGTTRSRGHLGLAHIPPLASEVSPVGVTHGVLGKVKRPVAGVAGPLDVEPALVHNDRLGDDDALGLRDVSRRIIGWCRAR